MLAWILAAMTPMPVNQTLYIGTYTGEAGSKGIYRTELDAQTGKLSAPKLAAEVTAPSYLCLGRDGRHLYAVNEYSDGEAAAFRVSASGDLHKLNSISFDGKGPCHISLSPAGDRLAISAYGGGAISILGATTSGQIGSVIDAFRNQGSGPNKRRQSSPHMHFAGWIGKTLYACDLGTDEVLKFDLNPSGTLTVDRSGGGKVPPGAGPRHFAVSQSGGHLYVNNEMAMSVSVFARSADGKLKLMQTASTLEDSQAEEGWSTAAIKRHPIRPLLFVSNRGHNSISTFGIAPDGKIKLVGMSKVSVVEPRDFAIDATGRWLVVGGQKSGDLETYQIDESGRMSPTGHRIQISKPVCLVFSPAKT